MTAHSSPALPKMRRDAAADGLLQEKVSVWLTGEPLLTPWITAAPLRDTTTLALPLPLPSRRRVGEARARPTAACRR